MLFRCLLAVVWLVVLMGFNGAIAADDFPQPFNTEADGQHPPTGEEMLTLIDLPPGFHITLFAAEPDVQQPICMDFDDRGRLWVAENYSYSGGPYERRLRDRIVILEDTTGDGRHDSRKIFWDQGWMLTSLAWGFGGLWILNDGTLSFIPDYDGDDLPDSEPVVMLDGWTKEAGHNFVNGLIWGPDGWLYGRHGITDTSWPGSPDTPRSLRQPINCGIWRFHPTRRMIEFVCHGTTNPWGLDYNEQGQFFMTNNVQGHLWHVIPGAHYQRMFGQDFNPHLYELMDQTADHYHWDTSARWMDSRDGRASDLGGGHSHCGGLIYQGTNFPAQYHGRMLMCNTHGRRININRLERYGSGYSGRREPDFMLVRNPWFRGVDLREGPDGAVFVADWSDHGECHDHDSIHRTSGRIYRIVYGKPAPVPSEDLSRMDDAALVRLTLSDPAWFARKSRRLLQERSPAAVEFTDVEQTLRNALQQPGEVRQLRALFALYSTGRLLPTPTTAGTSSTVLPASEVLNAVQQQLQILLQSPHESVRAAAVRLLLDKTSDVAGAGMTGAATTVAGDVNVQNTEDRGVGERPPEFTALMSTLCRLIDHESSGLVLLSIVAAGQKLDADCRLSLAEAFVRRLTRGEPLADNQLELMTWYLLEPAIGQPQNEGDPRFVSLLDHGSARLLRFIARKQASAADREFQPDRLIRHAAQAGDTLVQHSILQGLVAGYTGRRQLTTPSAWKTAAEQLADSSDQDVAGLALQLSTIFGNQQAIADLRQLVRDVQSDPHVRERAILALAEAQDTDSIPTFLNLLGDRAVCSAAIRAAGRFDHADVPKELLRRFNSFKGIDRELALDALAARESSALKLIAAVEAGEMNAAELTATQVRQLLAFNHSRIREVLERYWGIVHETPAARQAAVENWKHVLTPESLAAADLQSGAELYRKSCASCHRLYGEGGTIGPDLTGSNRGHLDYLLINLIDPSAVVPRQFTTSVIALTDGRIVTGVIVSETNQVISVQTERELLVLPLNKVEERTATGKSLMPDGLLDNLTEEQVRDLIAFTMQKR